MAARERVVAYSMHPYMRSRWAKVGRKLAFAAEDEVEWRNWRRQAEAVIRNLLGYDTLLRAPLQPRITEEQQMDGYRRQRVEIQTEPGVVMPSYVLIPCPADAETKGGPRYPAIVAPHGHGGGGKVAVAGIRENPEVAQAIETYNYDYGVQFVRAGFIVFCPDARGFGERQEAAAKGGILNSSCAYINAMAYPLGQTIAGMWAWDIHRLIDYIQTRDDCLADRVGCAGLSGGGLQTLWAAALDKRVRCAVISGYMYGYQESLLDMPGNCYCNYVPHLYEYMDMGDIAALIAPRPLLIETGNRDPLNGASGLANVRSQVDTIRRAYRALDAEDRLYHDIFEGEHRWNGVQAIPWMKRFLGQ